MDNSEIKKIILNYINSHNIKVQIGIIEKLLKITDNNELLAIKLLEYIAKLTNNKITIKALEGYLNIYETHECHAIINKIISRDEIYLNFNYSKCLTDKNMLFLILSLINSSQKIINEKSDINLSIFSKFNNDELTKLIKYLLLVIQGISFNFEHDYELFTQNIQEYKKQDLTKMQKYKNTKIYEIFGDTIRYL